jgi:hypothetical protein
MILRFGRHKLLIISASEIEGEVIRERKEAWRRGYKAGWAAKKREVLPPSDAFLPYTIQPITSASNSVITYASDTSDPVCSP